MRLEKTKGKILPKKPSKVNFKKIEILKTSLKSFVESREKIEENRKKEEALKVILHSSTSALNG